VTEVSALHTQIDLDIAQILARVQLGKRQEQELVDAGGIFDFLQLTLSQKIIELKAFKGG